MITAFNIAMSLLFAVLIISLSVTGVLAFKPLYYSAIERYGIEETSGMERDEIIENYDALIDYNFIGGPENLRFPTLPSSEEGLVHFAEVKEIFTGLQAAGIVSAGLLALLIFAGRFGGRRKNVKAVLPAGKRYGWLRYGGIIACVLPATVMAAAALWWDKVFVLFHEIVFDNDYWIFDAETDPVITMLPDGFFFECCMVIGALILILSAVAYFVYGKLRKRENAHYRRAGSRPGKQQRRDF